MDYDRVEILAKKLLHPRMEIRLRSASSILFKLESGIFDRRDIAQTSFRCTLLDGVNKSISIIISQQSTTEHIADATSETYQLVLLLLSILRLATYQQQLSIPERRSSTDDNASCTMILDHLYSMKAISGIDNKLNKMLDETIASLCSAGMSEESIYISRVQSDQLMKSPQGSRVAAGLEGGVPMVPSKQQLGLHMGAGAVLNSRLCYSGWRFASFSIPEDSSDDEWLFDLEVKIKLRHETTSTEIWSYLVNFPVEAIVQKTNILHAMLDVVGGPSSHSDIDSDPLGLHSATAIRWFTALLLKCRDAFSVQLEGSLCCYVPAAASDPLQRVAADDLGTADITMQLAQAMFVLRHPKIHRLSGDNVDSKPGLGLVPTPSYPGLAFACCAASMPLLQMRDADVARLVYSLLQVALPQLLEPQLRSCSSDDDPNGNSVHHLSDIESARFQHLFNRVEQVLSLFDDLFDFKGFLTSVYSDDEDPSASEAALEQSSFDILFLSTVTILFNAVPTSCLTYLQSERVPTFGITIKEGSGTSSGCSQERQQQVVCVGEKALQCLRRMATCRPLWAFLPPQSSDTILRCLKQLDEEYLSTIYHVECILESATNLTCGSRWPDSRAMLIKFLLANAEKFIGMLDSGRSMETTMVIGQGSSVLCAVLPVLLEAVVVAESDGPPLCASTSSVLNMILRVLACGAQQECKLHLLHSMVLWIGQSTMAECLSGVREKMLLAFSFQPSSRRLLLSSLCTPQIFHVLLMGCLENEFHENEDTINYALTLTSYSLHCLELLSEYILNHDDHLRCNEQSLPIWSTVLPAFKLLEWNRHNGVVSSTSVKRVLQLSQHIEDICRNSTSVVCRRSVSKSLVMGLFHSSKVVRAQCSLLIHRQLRLVTGEQYSLDIAGNHQSPTGRDPFRTEGGNMQLTGWKFSSTHSVRSSLYKNIGIHPREKSLVQAESSAKRGCFTHLDVRRVASLGLGCDESEPSLRASACNQLLDMLCGDDQLVRTADLSWAVLTTKQALRTVEKLFASRSRVDRVSTTAGDESLSAAQRGLLIAALKLSIFLTARVAAIRKMVSLFDSDDASSGTEVRESISLQILVELCLLSTVTSTAASGSETFQLVKCLSAQFLCSLCCSAETWCISTGSEADSIMCEIQPILEPTSERDQQSDVDLAPRSLSACLLIPSFLQSSLCFPSFRHDVAAADDRHKPSSIFPDLCVLLPARLSYNFVGILRLPSLPADNIMTILTESYMAPSVDRTHVATVTKLFQSIVNARHHTQLRRGLSFTSCIFNSNIDILKIFLSLQISLTTAVSNIVTIIPRTRKDHLTLNSVLMFLNDVFQSFKVHFPSVASSDSEFITLYHETLIAVLPSMEHYFESHFTTNLSVTIPPPLGNIDSDSTIQTEYLLVTTRAVSLSYFKLLLTLSSFIDLDRKLMFGESLMGSKLPSHLIGCFCNETHPYWSRFMAICTLGNLLRHHSGWESLISVKYEGIIDCGNMIDRLVRLLRLLRTPDSMIGSCIVVGALRLLYLILVEQARDLHLYFSVLQLEHDWNWLLRFIYDRRSEVKVLTLKIIDILVSNSQRSVDNDGISVSTIDSLEDIDTAAVAPSAPDERSNRNIVWPPHELLLYIIMDRVESISVRLQAVGVTISQWTTNGVKSSDLSIVSHVLSLIEECLSLRQFHSSASSVQGSLTCLMNLLQVQGCGPSPSRDYSVTLTILSVVRSKKIPGQIMELLDSSNYDNLLHKAMLRVGITANGFDYSHDSSDYYPRSVQSINSSQEQLSFIGDGWNNFLQRLEIVECLSWRAVTLSVCSFFVFFSRLDSSAFGQCILHSNLLFQLTTSFSSVRDITFNPKLAAVRQAVRFRIDLATISAQAELISLLINHQNKLADKVVDNFIQRNSLVPSNLLKKITLVLGQILMWYEANDQSESQSAAQQCLNSCLRLLTLLLNDSLSWFNLSEHLEVQQSNSGSTSEQLNYTFELLLDLRVIISSRCLPDEKGVLAARLDVTIAHFMQLSEEARYAFVGYRMKMHDQSSESRSSLFRQYVSSIAAATESIWCAPTHSSIAAAANNNNNNSSSSSSRNNSNNDTDVTHSLLTLKNRPRHGKGASSRSTVSSRDYSPSIHSNSTYSSKWRTKTRSYVWRKEGDNHGQLSLSELTDQLKLQLWSALLVLSASLTRNEEATNWAIELNLHKNLEKLLRFAARYSLTSTLSPSTLEAIAIGSSWTPSLGMIASAIYALSSSFSSCNVGAKLHFLCKGVAASAAIVKNDEVSQRHESNGSVLHHLLSVGVNRSTLPVARWLSLGLVGSILSSSAHSTSGGHQTVLKATISQILVLSAQQSVNSSAIDCDTVVHFLNTLTSILSSDDDITCLMQLSNKDSLSHVRSFHLSLCAKSPTEVSSESFKIMTFPEVIQWIWANSNSDRAAFDVAGMNCLAAATGRLVGRIGIVDRSNKTIGNILSEETLSVLSECFLPNINGRFMLGHIARAISALSLWNIVHHSEKAKCLVREILRHRARGAPAGIPIKHAEKAELCLLSLIAN